MIKSATKIPNLDLTHIRSQKRSSMCDQRTTHDTTRSFESYLPIPRLTSTNFKKLSSKKLPQIRISFDSSPLLKDIAPVQLSMPRRASDYRRLSLSSLHLMQQDSPKRQLQTENEHPVIRTPVIQAFLRQLWCILLSAAYAGQKLSGEDLSLVPLKTPVYSLLISQISKAFKSLRVPPRQPSTFVFYF